MEHQQGTPREDRFCVTMDVLKSPAFQAIFDVVKEWDVNSDDTGLHSGTGTDAVEILQAVAPYLRSEGVSKQEVESAIAGALFDFCGRLTTQEPAISVGSRENASPVLCLLTKWADERGLNLNKAEVLKWSEILKK